MHSDIVINIGKKIREIRNSKKLKLYETADKALISKGLLSKIENGRTIPSLPVLISIIKVLEVDMNEFFDGIEEDNSHLIIHRKKGDETSIEKEESIGFHYFSILSKGFSNVHFEAVVLKLDPAAQREKVTTDGYEYLYILNGRVDYFLDNEHYTLEEGDSLFFNGNIPHVPENNTGKTATILVIYIVTSEK